MLRFYQTNMEPIDQVKTSLSKIFPDNASLSQAKQWEEQLLSMCSNEELLWTFSFDHHSHQSSE